MGNFCAASGPGLVQLSILHWGVMLWFTADKHLQYLWKPLHNLSAAVASSAAGWDNRRDKEWWKACFLLKGEERAWSEEQGIAQSICAPRIRGSKPCPIPVILGLLWFSQMLGSDMQANLLGTGSWEGRVWQNALQGAPCAAWISFPGG